MSCFKKIVQSIVSLTLLALLAGCTARPLYSDSQMNAATREFGTQGVPMSKENAAAITDILLAITIDEAKDRQTQILRNRLTSLIAHPWTTQTKSYQLSLAATTQTIATVQIDVGDRTDRTGRPSAGTVRAQARYILRDGQGTIIAQGQRSMTAPFDRPRQEYANLRAEEDAKKHALEELAMQIFFALVHDLYKIEASSQTSH